MWAVTEMDGTDCPIWDVLSSRGKVKVLKTLVDTEELNITEIVRKTELSHRSVKTYLSELCDTGLVELKKFGRIRIYRYRVEVARARALQYLFKIWDHDYTYHE